MAADSNLPLIGQSANPGIRGQRQRSVQDTQRVAILTATFRLEGNLHLSSGSRVLDELNKAKEFLPLTNAQIFAMSGNTPVDTRDFIAVNKASIVMVTPIEQKADQ